MQEAGTHYLQGATSIIAQLSWVSPSLPPCPQAFTVRPGCQPGGGGTKGSCQNLLGPSPDNLLYVPIPVPRVLLQSSPKQLIQLYPAMGPESGFTYGVLL